MTVNSRTVVNIVQTALSVAIQNSKFTPKVDFNSDFMIEISL